MATSFKRVPFDTTEPYGENLIRIFRHRGRVVATVTQYQWYEPDGHEYTGYAELETSPPQDPAKVLSHHRKSGYSVAIEDESLWNPAWGRLFQPAPQMRKAIR